MGGLTLIIDGGRRRVGEGVNCFREGSIRIIGGEGEAVLGGLSSLDRSERSKRARFSAVSGVVNKRDECARDFDGV